MHYTIIPAKPEAHLYHVTCLIDTPDPAGQIVALPTWIPGSYMIREFAKNIVRIWASSNGQAVMLTKRDKASWQAAPCAGPLLVEYEVYAWDLSVRTAHLDITHGYFNGTSVFLQVQGQEQSPCSVDIMAPPTKVEGQWRVATTLARDGAEQYGFGRYRAQNYDDLIDHPVEMADFVLATFEAGGVPHDIVISGRHNTDIERLCCDLKAICETHIAMFGELPAMERYLFLVWVVGEGFGGLEHRSSCSLLCARNSLPLVKQVEISDDYRSFLGLCSHEYFHAWNIKQIKPAAFVPYRLEQEAYTRQLWAFEGITSYYDDLGLVRSGLINDESYLQLLAQAMTRVWRSIGRLKQSVADSSFDAWTKFYRQDENAPNAIVSYYVKGSLIALVLDLIIRRESDGKKSLDDVMRRLWQEYGKPLKGVPEGYIEQLAAEIAGCSLDDFFARYLYGTEDPPVAELLAELGVDFILRPASTTEDKGGSKPSKSLALLSARPILGVKITNQNNRAQLLNVFEGSAAEAAGLAAGDVLLAIDCLQVTAAGLEKHLSRYQVGDEIKIHLFRRDELMTLKATLKAPPLDTVDLPVAVDASLASLQRRKAWLYLQ